LFKINDTMIDSAESPFSVLPVTQTRKGFSMDRLSVRCKSKTFNFSDSVSGFLTAPGLPFVDILSAQRIKRVCAKHGNLFGRTYTTAIVLWAFVGGE
jgi:hypothetical protein